MKIEVSIEGVVSDDKSEQQMLVLKPKFNHDGKCLPIWIGNTEASSIKTAMEEGFPAGRPLSHDLLKNILTFFHIPLKKVVIHKMVQGTFFAHLYFDKKGTELVVDSRPSDAVSLAVRMNAPVFIEEEVYTKQQVTMSNINQIESD
jgi:bifunctional DNase/RNase